ncbi:MAG TPA: hypothetical protein VK425_10845 [Acidimicrobiales bacterium]|nr:hypothetical protein [Acidimicrobiales bacterium]
MGGRLVVMTAGADVGARVVVTTLVGEAVVPEVAVVAAVVERTEVGGGRAVELVVRA